jgi:hypothetical protein
LVKFKAEVTVEMRSKKLSEAIAESLSPDNQNVPKGLKVKTSAQGKRVISTVACNKKIETFLATLDDLLSCLQTAEKTLRAV